MLLIGDKPFKKGETVRFKKGLWKNFSSIILAHLPWRLFILTRGDFEVTFGVRGEDIMFWEKKNFGVSPISLYTSKTFLKPDCFEKPCLESF